VHGMMQ